MPYLKSISLHTTVNRSLAYILNPDKSEDLLYTNAVNCLPNAKDAYLAMKTVYEHFSSHKFNEPLPKQGKGRVKAIHYIQSFDPKDNISPKLAHQIARAFARKTFGDSCQVVIATHNDKNHVHNHIIINTYGIDGRKFNANKKTLDELKEISDRVCLAFGIQPFDKSKAKRTTVAYNEWQGEQRGTSWKQKIRLEIDALILKVKNVDELLAELEILGYTVRRGKYILVKAPDQQRAVRLKTLGEDYTIESLASRILWKDVGSGVTLLGGQPSELSERYSATIYDVEQLALTGRKVQRRRDRNVYLYNFPERTGYGISPNVVRKLALAHPNIVGIKDTISGMDNTRELVKQVKSVRPDFEIYSGFDDNFAHNVLGGGNGCIAGLSNLYPELTSAWAAALRNSNYQKAAECQQKIDRLMDIYSVGKPFVPFIKAALASKGIIAHAAATKPMPAATVEQSAKLNKIMEEYENGKKD